MEAHEVMHNIVKNIMKNTGVKQGFLAAKCGFTDKQFSAMLNGYKAVTSKDIAKFCKGLDKQPQDIIILDQQHKAASGN